MAKYNLQKAKAKLKAAENEALRDEILSNPPLETTKAILSKFYTSTGWKRAHIAQYMGYSANAVKRWENENENTVVIRDVCAAIQRKYWHRDNRDRFKFELDEESTDF
jgi:hypothetical protein